MSLYIAERGEKAHLREAWSAREYDFPGACRRWGRNDAFWILCYRLHLAGEDLPDEREQRRYMREANRATGGLDRDGQSERYTLYEARMTIEQVSSYPSHGLAPLLARGKGKTDSEQAMLEALRSIARSCARHTFTASHRQLARASGISLARAGEMLKRLEKHRLVWLVGHTKALPGRASGTSIWSLRPPRPSQRIDEVTPPVYDARRCRWTWRTPSDRGRITKWMYLRAAKRFEAGMPNVLISPSPDDLGDQKGSQNNIFDSLRRPRLP